MRRRPEILAFPMLLVLAFPMLLVLACSATSSTPAAVGAAGDASMPVDELDASIVDAAADVDANVDKAATCASTFGHELTNAFGRLDGRLLAVVTPPNQTCAMPNGDHVIVQVTMNGAAYRLLVNVMSDRSGIDPKVRMAEVSAPLAGGAWAEGWHAGTPLDYVTTLGVHDMAFTPYEKDALSARIASFLTIGEEISVFATSSGGAKADSAHLVHRNATNQDGAIVVGAATSSPKWLLFHFDGQSF